MGNMEFHGNSLPQGTRLRSYRIIRKLGQGGFGITYLAHDEEKNCDVVIKENMPGYIACRHSTSLQVGPTGAGAYEAEYRDTLERFIREANLLSQLFHPHIVPVRAAFRELGTAYYVMPYIEGNELHKAAPAYHQINEKWLRPVLYNILKALAYLHKKGLLHRDLKPQNILLCEDNTPVLIDFGTARAVGTGATTQMTQIGTMGYSPAEQFTAQGKLGAWSDMYALGATCYHLITGACPPDYVARMLTPESCPPLAGRPELNGRFSPQFLSSIDKAFAMKPEARWQTAKDWLDVLDGAQAPAAHTSPAGAPPAAPYTASATPGDYYNQGSQYMEQGHYRRGFEAYLAGHNNGDVNCTAQLAECYRNGSGIYIDNREFMRLARELESRNCPLSNLLLAVAFADGLGCSVDYNRADAYARRWIADSAAPMPGVNEHCRLFMRAFPLLGSGLETRWKDQQAAGSHELPPINLFHALLEYADSPVCPNPYTYKALEWIERAGQNEIPPIQIKEGVRREMNNGYVMAISALAMLELHCNPMEAKRLLTIAAEQWREPVIQTLLLNLCEDDSEISALLEQLNLSMQYGPSHLMAENLPACRLTLSKPSIAGIFEAYNENVAARLIDNNEMTKTVRILTAPTLTITNVCPATLSDLSLRIVVPGYGEMTFAINEEILSGHALDVELSDYDIDWRPEIRLELQSSGYTIAQLTPEDVWNDLTPVPPMLLAYWEKGFFGSLILCVRSLSGTLTNVQLHKQGGVTSTPVTITEDGEPAKIGWMEMSDSTAPEIDHNYAITCDEADPVLVIPRSGENESSCAFAQIAKWTGAVALGVLAGS